MNKTVDRTSEIAPGLSGSDDGAGVEPTTLGRVESATLFQRGREVIIVHRGQEYRLRITKSDKLILTK
ncbi:MAG: hemin uptake protein HemP [Candidatus Rokuibacteriota bacterium]|jgi:hemin uptake protein HemP|nr:MAG: hemin uptake protein HemP [Candidatus Rokubacteria bacterium]PYO10345.1 MAG: hemin uptake protein HemP [Candidatus Rokubacteria bacterium]